MKIIHMTSIPFLLCLFLIFVLSADPHPNYSFQKKQSLVDWAQANSRKVLEDKYSFLVEEYKRIAADWERIFYEESGSKIPHNVIEELLVILDAELHLINPYLFQKWAYDNIQPQAYEIASNEKIQEIIENWAQNSSFTLKEQKDFGFIQNFIAATWAWKIYTHLVQELDRANLIFYEGFESGDLSRWDLTGTKNNISLDSQRKVKGRYSLKLRTDEKYTPVQTTLNSLPYFPLKIRIQWQAWLPSIEKECVQCHISFDFFGIRLVYKCSNSLGTIVFATEQKVLENKIQPNQWHLFDIIYDYEKKFLDVFIDNEIIWERIPIEIVEISSARIDHISIGYSDFFGIPAWIDEIKISYVN